MRWRIGGIEEAMWVLRDWDLVRRGIASLRIVAMGKKELGGVGRLYTSFVRDELERWRKGRGVEDEEDLRWKGRTHACSRRWTVALGLSF